MKVVLVLSCLWINISGVTSNCKSGEGAIAPPLHCYDEEGADKVVEVVDAVPLLVGEMVRPAGSAECKEFIFPTGVVGMCPRTADSLTLDGQFGGNDEAVLAAKNWIAEQYGSLPDGVALHVIRVEHHPVESEFFPFEQGGHRVVLRSHFRGIATDSMCTVNLIGRKFVSGSIEIWSYKVVGEPVRIISRENAKKLWEHTWRSSAAQVDDAAKDMPKIRYSGTIWLKHTREISEPFETPARGEFSPMWRVSYGVPFFIDARTGDVFLDD